MPQNNYHIYLKAVRQHLRLPQAEMGESMGYTQGMYSELERGDKRFTLDKLDALCKAHNINPYYILYGQLPMFEPGEPAPLKSRITMRRMKDILDQAPAAEKPYHLEVINELLEEVIALQEVIQSKDEFILLLEKELRAQKS